MHKCFYYYYSSTVIYKLSKNPITIRLSFSILKLSYFKNGQFQATIIKIISTTYGSSRSVYTQW